VFAEAKDVKFITTAGVISEIEEYIPVLAKKKGLSEDVMEAAFSLLKLEVVSSETYSEQIPAAMILIGKRDPEDVELGKTRGRFSCLRFTLLIKVACKTTVILLYLF